MVYIVLTCQNPGIYHCETKDATSTLLTFGFDVKSEYLTSVCKLRVDDFKVWVLVLRFQKKTNEQTQRYYLFKI